MQRTAADKESIFTSLNLCQAEGASVLIVYILHVEQQQTVLFQRNACDAYVIDVFGKV